MVNESEAVAAEEVKQFQEMMIALAEAGVIETRVDDGEFAVRVLMNPGPEEMVRIYEEWKLRSDRLV
jgi:hypothetical protein